MSAAHGEVQKSTRKQDVEPNDVEARELETIIGREKAELEYTKILHKGPLVIHEKPEFNVKKYYHKPIQLNRIRHIHNRPTR